MLTDGQLLAVLNVTNGVLAPHLQGGVRRPQPATLRTIYVDRCIVDFFDGTRESVSRTTITIVP